MNLRLKHLRSMKKEKRSKQCEGVALNGTKIYSGNDSITSSDEQLRSAKKIDRLENEGENNNQKIRRN